MPTELLQLSSLLLFLPGIGLFEILNERYQLRMSFLERILAGALTWNFIFASASALLGLFPHLLLTFFWLFGFLSIFLVVFSFAFKLWVWKDRESIQPSITNDMLKCFLYLLPLVLTVSIIVMFTPIPYDWDMWAVYLPMVKSIASRGDLLFNEYFLSPLAISSYPPYVPLAYAWVCYITGGDYYRLIPIMYYLLLGIATYLLSKSIFERKEIAIGATVISMSSLVTLAALFGYTLSLDLPTAIFICSSMIYLAGIFKGKTELHYLLLLGISLSLLMLTRVVGLLMAFSFAALILLCTSMPYKKGLFVISFLAPFYALVLTLGFVGYSPALFVYSMILLIIVRRTNLSASLETKRALAILLPLLPALTYLVAIGQYSGLWLYGFFNTIPNYAESFWQLQSFQTQGFQTSFVSLLRLDDIFLRYGFLFYAPLILVGLMSIIKERKLKTDFLYVTLIMFLSIFVLYPQQFYPSLADEESYIRRYLYIIPIVSVLVSKGFYWLLNAPRFGKTRDNAPPSIYLTSLILYNAFSAIYVLGRVQFSWPYPLVNIFALAELRVSLGQNYANVFDILVLTCALFICLALATLPRIPMIMKHKPMIMKHKPMIMKHKPMIMKVSSILLLSFVVIGSFSVVSYFQQPLTSASVFGTNTRTMGLPTQKQDLVDFFKTRQDDGIVIGYQKYYLITFSNRRLIDLSLVYGFMLSESLFQDTNLTHLITRLNAQNVRYIIEPRNVTNMDTAEYNVFNHLRSEFGLFDALLVSSYVQLLESTGYYNVYELVS